MSILHVVLNTRKDSKEWRNVYEWIENHQGFVTNRASMNGEVVYHVFSSRNGTSNSWEVLVEKLKDSLSSESNDTYGLIYMYDDENIDYPDEWQLWIIKHRQLIRKTDPFFSPYSKEIG